MISQGIAINWKVLKSGLKVIFISLLLSSCSLPSPVSANQHLCHFDSEGEKITFLVTMGTRLYTALKSILQSCGTGSLPPLLGSMSRIIQGDISTIHSSHEFDVVFK